MRKILSLIIICTITMMAYAVPARRGWQTRTQADGTTIEVQQIGDEFYHYMINRDGQQVREINGMYEVVGETPTADVAKARRAKAVARRQRKDVGTEPYLAPKGLIILANFKDASYKSANTKAVMDSLINAKNCQVNKDGSTKYPSAAQYFKDQSYGKYNPVFDVVGPVTLSKNTAYYGTNYDEYGNEDENGDYEYAADAIVEACKLVENQVDFSQYDWNNDGEIDFVYVIYAGKGEADGGASTTIWPHNWSVDGARASGVCTYSAANSKVDGLKINNYACSGELNGQDGSLNGIGTFCHEFGHVLGLPDLYDTDYGTNYNNNLTPNDWNIMDGGSYNADGHCPPNYDPWERYFFGWQTPVNPGNEGQNLTLKANGTEGYVPYQINASGTLQAYNKSGVCYYIENRQAQGWDAPLTGHGLLIWKINFNATAWTDNAPNNTSTSNSPLYTVVSATGTKIGTWYNENTGKYVDDCPNNTFPGSGKKTSWTGVTGKPLLNIAESGQIVTLTYIEEPTTPVDPFEITWMSNGSEFAKTTSTGKIVLPATDPTPCDGKVFMGWCSQADYKSATTAPTFVAAGQAATEGAIFYAVFATKEGEGGAAAFDGSTGGTFKIYAEVGGTKYYAAATVSNNKLQSTTNEADAADFVLTAVTDGFTIQTDGKYLSNGSKTNVSLSNTAQTWTFESGEQGTWRVNSSANAGRALVFRAGTYNVFGAYATSNINGTEYFDLEIGGKGGATYKDYTTTCGGGTDIENVVVAQPAAVKAIRNGQLVIIRGEEIYSITGERIQ